MEINTSPVSVVTALRQSRKGRLSYDRNWMDRNSSVERVVKEVTSGLGGMGIGDKEERIGGRNSKCEPLGSGKVRQKDRGREIVMSPITRTRDPGHIGHMSPVTRAKQETGPVLSPVSRARDPGILLSPVTRVKDTGPVLSPVTLSINRDDERDIGNPRCIVMSRDSETSVPSETSLNISKSHNNSHSQNYSLNTSHGYNQSLNNSCSQNSSQNSSLFIYDTPELVKYQKFPRVDLPKLRLPPSLFVGREDSTEDESDTEYFGIKDNKVIDIVTGAGEGKENIKPSDKSQDETEIVVGSHQSPIEEELVRYELKCREDAERRVEERKAKWEAVSRERDREAREKMEAERMNRIESDEKEVELAEIERRVEERLMMQQQEREERQKELIQQAKKEEQMAKEQLEKRKRISEQTEHLAPVHSRIKTGVQQLLQLWSGQQDKQLFRAEVGQLVPQLLQECNTLLKEARSKVVEGECGKEIFEKLQDLEGNLGKTVQMLEEDLARIEKEKREEAEKAQQLQQKKEEEERKAAEEAAVAAAQEKQAAVAAAVSAAPQVSQAAPVVATPAAQVSAIPSPATAVAAVAPSAGVLNSISAENKAWYDSIVQFKTDFVKDVTFTDAEKPYKFSLQKAINTPLNSLSGVSPSHLQDKINKLEQLLSGQQVTVVDKTISTNQHQHARSFCLALAAKKLAKQGEDVVSVDAKSAFPAATLALALWDKYPEFGNLLLAYMFELCPFLVPFHPQQSAGQTDKEYYISLGYKYDGETIEKQDKYLKRMSGLSRLYAALSVSHIPKASSATTHPHPPAKVWAWLSSICNLTPHTDITASLLLDVLEVSGHAMFANYGKLFGKMLLLIKDKYFPQLEHVKSEGGPTVRLDQFLTTAIRGQSIREPEGGLRQGFV